MSRGPEAAFAKRVRAAWPGHYVRIEASDGEVDPGTPDTNVSVGYKGGWIELKVWPDNVSAVQLAWHEDAIQRGAYCMVLSLMPDGTVWLGDAGDYDRHVRAHQAASMMQQTYGRIGPECVVLQAALNVVACALTGSPIRQQKNSITRRR